MNSLSKKRSSFVATESKWKLVPKKNSVKDVTGVKVVSDTNIRPEIVEIAEETVKKPVGRSGEKNVTYSLDSVASKESVESLGDMKPVPHLLHPILREKGLMVEGRPIVKSASFGSPDQIMPPPLHGDLPKLDPDRVRSQTSLTSNSVNAATINASKELTESVSHRIRRMKWALLSIICNMLLLIFISPMRSGVLIPLSPDTVMHIGAVIVELVLLLTNIITLMGMDDGMATMFGYWMSLKHGYSMAASGFCRTPPSSRYAFVNRLSHNSTCKKVLEYLSYLFIFVEMIKLVTPIPATALLSEPVLIKGSNTDCVEFNQNYSQIDRGVPSFDNAVGLGELVFGTAIGQIRAEFALNHTTFMMGPQLMGSISSNQWVVGNGLVADILTNCSCVEQSHLSYYIGNATVASSLRNQLLQMPNNELGTVFQTVLDNTNDTITIYNAFTGSLVCGGRNTVIWPLCTTTVWNHRFQEVRTQYQTDGTSASIASVAIEIFNDESTEASMSWLYNAFTSVAPSGTPIMLPPTVPGLINPILYWTTSDLVAFDISQMESGIEMMIAILLRGGIQRTYNFAGISCFVQVYAENSATIYFSDYGFYLATCIFAIQLVLGCVAAFSFYPLFTAKSPFSPAIRVMQEASYFGALLTQSGLQAGFPVLSSAESYTIWQALDKKVWEDCDGNPQTGAVI
ncbi:hypothetical protein HDU91_006960 [Kappamyces sp. JEL0680]|nr:hypothetical protein HDU91_006960 [Kappamyces sp. JEL0680]